MTVEISEMETIEYIQTNKKKMEKTEYCQNDLGAMGKHK